MPFSRNGVHERNVDLDGLGNQVLDFTKHREVILGLDILRICGVKASHETT